MSELWYKIRTNKWIVPVLIGISIVLSTMTFNEYNNSDRALKALQQANIERDSFELAEKAALYVADSIYKENIERDKLIEDLSKKQLIVDYEAAKLRQNNKYLSSQVRAAKVLKDTVAYYAACDSLTVANDSLIAKTVQDSTLRVAAVKLYEERIESTDSLLAKKERLYSQLRTNYNEVLTGYNSLGSDYKSLSKKYNKQKTKNAITLGVSGGIIAALVASLIAK